MPGLFGRLFGGTSEAAAYLDRAMADLLAGNLELAIAEATRAVELDPTLALAFINRGVALP
jgi:Flp pilus assembly protein TadD